MLSTYHTAQIYGVLNALAFPSTVTAPRIPGQNIYLPYTNTETPCRMARPAAANIALTGSRSVLYTELYRVC